MGMGDIHHRARARARSPRAFGVCDFCGGWFNRVDLLEVMEYYGTSVRWTGYLADRDCLDKPQPQLQPYILPPDPVPIKNPRPEIFSISRGANGYTQMTTWGPGDFSVPYPIRTSKSALLAAAASLSGVPTPANYADLSAAIPLSSVTTLLVPLVPASSGGPLTNDTGATVLTDDSGNTILMQDPGAPRRTFLLLYNPNTTPIVVSNGNASFAGDSLAMLLGPGSALLQSGANCYQGAVTVCVLQPGETVWAFVAPGTGGGGLTDDTGAVTLTDDTGNIRLTPP